VFFLVELFLPEAFLEAFHRQKNPEKSEKNIIFAKLEYSV